MFVRIPALLLVATAVVVATPGCGAPDQNGDAVPGIIPAPTVFEVSSDAAPFRLTERSRLVVRSDGAASVAEAFAATLRRATGFTLPVVGGDAGASDLSFEIGIDAAVEGYTLESRADGLRLRAGTAEGLYRGTQTVRQLLPPEIERADAASPPSGGWVVPAASVVDAPRYAYRGVMLDVARHFFPVGDVLALVDRIALLKFNALHLHLTDDQGWRLEIASWPALTEVGAATSVDGAGAGFYTKDDYRRIVEYAAERFITVVPEIDLPGHTNAALSAYPELNCDGVATAPYEGTSVGFSSLCASPARAEATGRFLADVTREVAELTPGPWLHLGGDESLATSVADYRDLVQRITAAGAATGKTIIGWHEMGASRELPPGTVGQYWSFVEPDGGAAALARSFVEQGGRVIMSPADVAYLDMRYADDPEGPHGRRLGQDWAKGPTTLEEAYAWEPTAIVDGVGEAELLGVEAPVWTEFISAAAEVEFMLFPRAAAIAEIGWSPPGPRDVAGFLARVASLGVRLDALGVHYHRVHGVPWASTPGHPSPLEVEG